MGGHWPRLADPANAEAQVVLPAQPETSPGPGSPAAPRWPRLPDPGQTRPDTVGVGAPWPGLPDDAPLWTNLAGPDDDEEHLIRLDAEQRGVSWNA
ncbi:hypothetical protein GCM10009682_58260 [Luedemannella flava]|uniref:Uncharacterized protein n=1 Tax=Luedemannella flava TaxID=349316 RepID=A0ABN2MNS3_9ACTN